MPWKETCPMDERLRFISACTEEDSTMAELCRRFGISRKTGYKWLARYDELGATGLQQRGSVAQVVPHRTPDAVIDAVVALRKQHPFWGPKKLRKLLLKESPDTRWPAASTIGELLRRNGLIRPRRRRVRSPDRRGPLEAFAAANDIWCTDFKGHFAVGDGTRCHPLTLSDGFSRYLLKCEALTAPKTNPVREQFELAFREFGLPLRIRSDNGPPFASVGAGGLSALSVWWIKLQITPERIEPGQPQQNGRHERMHRTLKLETPIQATLADQQRAFDRFRHEFNEVRPHEALGQDPPAKFYEPSRRLYPTDLVVPEYPDFDRQRWVSNGGVISWRHHTVQIAQCLAGEPVGMRQISDSCWEVVYGSHWLGVLDDRDAIPKLRRERPANASVLGRDDEAAGSRDHASRTVLPELLDRGADTQTTSPELPD